MLDPLDGGTFNTEIPFCIIVLVADKSPYIVIERAALGTTSYIVAAMLILNIALVLLLWRSSRR